MEKVKIGIIGGSGLDNIDILENRKEKAVTTVFGKPSDNLICGQIQGVECVLLARHGRHHNISPCDVNYRANIAALMNESCSHILATTACGSLQEHIHPGDIVIVDQFIDRTHGRRSTFYDGEPQSPAGICHIPMNQPFCEKTRKILQKCCSEQGFRYRESGTVLTIQGPRFSSKAESILWRSWGADVVNMSTVPEVVLANEAGILYAAIALVTDYDSWRDDVEAVSVELAVKNFSANAQRAIKVLLAAIPSIADGHWSEDVEKRMMVVKSSVM